MEYVKKHCVQPEGVCRATTLLPQILLQVDRDSPPFPLCNKLRHLRLGVRTKFPRELTIPTKLLMISPHGRYSYSSLIE